MKMFLAVAAFTLLTVAFFAGFSNFGIPQMRPEPPPEEETFDLAAMTMDQFVALGERVFEGKGTCTLCHNPVGGRAPLLEESGKVATERLADPRYEGDAADVEGYLYESMVDPSAYVVAGFGKTGSGDTVSPMPNMLTGAIGLTEAEIASVIAYLQDLAGLEITVEIPTDIAEETKTEAGAEGRTAFATPEEAIADMGCGACHKVAGEEGDLGPDLSAVGATRDRDFLRRAILDPNADITQDFEPDLMPDDYGDQLYANELEMLVDYLAELK